MSPTRTYPFAQQMNLRPAGWSQAFSRAAETSQRALPRIHGYRIERRVGQGRTSTAYLAQDIGAGGKRVLKVLRPDLAASASRLAAFRQEFAVPHAVRHQHVIRVFDLVAGEGSAYIALEYLGGGDLGRLIRCRPTAREALALLRQAASALAELHRAGFVHGDIKPANLLLRYSGDLVLADFGLARSLHSSCRPTQAGAIVGTPAYASPEQAEGDPGGTAADVYSLGVVFYEMLCGQPPFPGHTLMEVLCQHLMAAVPRLPEPLASFQPLLDSMLAKKIASRLPDGQALLDRIDLMAGCGSVELRASQRDRK